MQRDRLTITMSYYDELTAYRDCTVTDVTLRHNGTDIGFDSIVSFSKEGIALVSGTVIRRGDVEGSLTFSSPGFAAPLILSLSWARKTRCVASITEGS